VFVVGCFGDWRHPAKVLFESESVRRNTPPSREAREETAKCLAAGVGKRYDSETEILPVAFDWQSGGDSRGLDPKDTAMLQRNQVPAVAQPIAIHPHVVGRAPTSGPQGKEYIDDGSAYCMDARGVPQSVAQPVAMRESGQGYWMEDAIAGTLRAEGENRPSRPSNVVAQLSAFPINTLTLGGRPDPVNDARMTLGVGADGDPQFTLQAAHSHAVATAMQVRRLTPVECERLQGFPDGYTNIPWRKKSESPDGPRYKALGNSMAVPVMRWIGERINKVDNDPLA
jgi:DNA (cytosine-5)-methyltransferase 1